MKKNLKITLIQCDIKLGVAKVPTQGKGGMPPLGLMYLSAYLKRHGFQDITIADLILETDRRQALIDLLKGLDPDNNNLIGFYMNTRTRFAAQEAIKIAREMVPGAIICSGGPHPTLDREGTLKNCEGLDFIVIGEGEETFLEAVTALSRDFSIEALSGMQGTSIRTGREIVHNELRPRIKDLDSVSRPEREMVNIRNYQFSFKVMDKDLQDSLVPTTMITGRGCPYQCIFCSVADQWQRVNTYASPGTVVAEMKMLKEKYGFNSVYLCDDTFTLNKKRTTEICNRLIDEKVNMYWFCEIRANTVNEELLTLMYKAGLRSVAMAVESASPRILKDVVKKGITLQQATDTIEICKKIGMHAKIFFSYSYPSERLDDVKMTLDYIKEAKPVQPIMSRLLVYPGTPLFKYARENGLVPDNFDWFTYYPFYDALSNETLTPVFIDKLSGKDLVWIRNELARMFGAQAIKKKDIITLVKIFLKNCSRIKSREDIEIIKYKIVGQLRQLF